MVHFTGAAYPLMYNCCISHFSAQLYDV